MASRTLKKLEEGQEMPADFWNYLVNPITGYYYSIMQDRHMQKIGTKYIKPNNGGKL
jgi:hypothetical protein